MGRIDVGNVAITKGGPFTVIAGPCVIESQEHCFFMASALQKICQEFGVQFIFKASFDKANRSSIHTFRGPGIDEGLKILNTIKSELNIPVTSDIHLPEQAQQAAQVLDMLQIPAFLCRQTDLLVAASRTGLPVNCKKGQFMAPEDMRHVLVKCQEAGCEQVVLTERGTSFGYHNLIVDMTSIKKMQELGAPVCFDASHCVQKPASLSDRSGGDASLSPTLANAALAAGADLLFLEVHDKPEEALSDAKTQLSLEVFKNHIQSLKKLYNFLQKERHELQNIH